MKNKILLTLLLLVSCLVLTSCNNCKHEWEEIGVTQVPSCKKEGRKEYVCTLCDKRKIEAIPTSEHAYSLSIIRTEEKHQHECLVCKAVVDSEEHQFVVNENGKKECSLCHYIEEKGNTVYFENLTNSFSQGFKTTVNNLYMVVGTYDYKDIIEIDNASLIFKYENNQVVGVIEGKFDLTEITENYDYENDLVYTETETFTIEGTIVIENEFIYLAGSRITDPKLNEDGNYYLAANILSMAGDDNAPMMELLKNAQLSDELTARIEALLNKVYSALGTNETDIIEDMLDLFFIKEGNVYTFNFAKIKELTDLLSTRPLKEVFEHYFGEGSFEKLQNNIISIMTQVKIGELYEMLERLYGINIIEALELVEDVVYEITGGYTLNELLGVDLKKELNNYEFKNKTFLEVIAGDTDVDDFSEGIKEVFEEIGETETEFYQNNPEIEYLINIINDNLFIQFETNENGSIQDLTIKFNWQGEGDNEEFNIDIDLTLEEYDGEVNTLEIKELVESKYGSVDFVNAKGLGNENVIQYDSVNEILNFQTSSGYEYNPYNNNQYVKRTVIGSVDLSDLESYMSYSSCGDWVLLSLNLEYTYQQITEYYEISSDNDEVGELVDKYSSSRTSNSFNFAYNTVTKEIVIYDCSEVASHDYQLQDDGSYKCVKCE